MGERHDQPATSENLEVTAQVTSVASPPANGRVAGCRSVGTERTSCAEWTIGWYRMWISPLTGTRRTPTVGASRHCQIASPTLTVQAAGLDSGGGSKSAALRIQEAAMAARPLRDTVRRGDKTRGHSTCGPAMSPKDQEVAAAFSMAIPGVQSLQRQQAAFRPRESSAAWGSLGATCTSQIFACRTLDCPAP